MADNSVFITGAAEGALADALTGLPPWATQQTAEEIQQLLNRLVKIQSDALAQAIKCCGSGGGLKRDELEGVNKEVEKLAKSFKRVNEEDAKKRKRSEREEKEGKEEENRSKKSAAASFALNKLFVGLAASGKVLGDVQKQYFNTSNDLFQSGINLLNGNKSTTSSMISLNQMVTLTGLRLQTLQKVMQQYSSSINAVGANKFAKTLSLTNERMIALGYSSEQQAEFLGTLIESESAYTDIRSKSSVELADDAARLGKQMMRLSVLTGQSSEKLQENLRALSKNTDSTVVSAVYGAEAAKRMNLFSGSFKDADIQSMFQKLGAATAPQITKSYQALAAAGQGQLASELTRIAQAARDGAISPEEARKQATDLARSISGPALQTLQVLADKGYEGASETLSAISALRAEGQQTSMATVEETDAATKSQASIARFSSALEETQALAQRTFPLLEKQVDLASAALEKFTGTVQTSTDVFSAETRSWIGIGIQILAAIASVALGAKILRSGFTLTGASIAKAGSLVTKTFSLMGSAAAWLGNGIKAVAGYIPRAFSFISSGAVKVGSLLGKLVNPVTKVIAAFAAGAALGTAIYNMVKNAQWFTDATDFVFSGIESVISGIYNIIGGVGNFFSDFGSNVSALIPGVSDISKFGNDLSNALQSISELWVGQIAWFSNMFGNIKGKVADWFSWVPGFESKSKTNVTNAKSESTKTQISVPKTPAPSTIKSPSAVPAAASTTTDSAGNVTQNSGFISQDNGITKTANNNDINSILDHQTMLLAKLLESSQSMVSVNRDILKFSKH